MPFCPQCRAEYRAGVTHCADDGTELVDALPADDLTEATLVTVYASYHQIEGDRIRAFLEDEGIACYLRRLRRSMFPTEAGAEAPTHVAVPPAKAERAVELIKQARSDGVLSDDGAFVK